MVCLPFLVLEQVEFPLNFSWEGLDYYISEANAKDMISGGALWELVRISRDCSREDIRTLAHRTLTASPTFQAEMRRLRMDYWYTCETIAATEGVHSIAKCIYRSQLEGVIFPQDKTSRMLWVWCCQAVLAKVLLWLVLIWSWWHTNSNLLLNLVM